jgi:hypothetical protein
VQGQFTVCPDGSGDYATIQEAVDAAPPGETILLCTGVFTGPGNRDISFRGKALTIRSINDDPGNCVIDCEASEAEPHVGFRFTESEGPLSVLQGVTVRNGFSGRGGAVVCHGSSPTIANCVFHLNRADTHGAAIYTYGGAPYISRCIFLENSFIHYYYYTFGGGISCFESSPVIVECTFVDNSAVFGGAVASTNSSFPSLSSCTIAFNTVTHTGCGLHVGYHSVLEASNCIIAFNEIGTAVYCQHDGEFLLTCCDIYGNAGGDWVGCIADQHGVDSNCTADPLFCGPVDGSTPMIHADASAYTLQVGSPCLPGNHPHGYDCGLVGAHGQGCGYVIGPIVTEARTKGERIAIETVTWGRIRTGFRR